MVRLIMTITEDRHSVVQAAYGPRVTLMSVVMSGWVMLGVFLFAPPIAG